MRQAHLQNRRGTIRDSGIRRPRVDPRLSMVVIAIALGALLAGCYVAPGPGYPYRGWCYYHPYRC
jgi:hypothetical protein